MILFSCDQEESKKKGSLHFDLKSKTRFSNHLDCLHENEVRKSGDDNSGINGSTVINPIVPDNADIGVAAKTTLFFEF